MSHNCAVRGVRRLERALTQLYDEMLRPSGLRATQLNLLTAIRRIQPVAVKELAEAMGMDRTTLTRNLALLERDGLVRSSPDSADRRIRTIRLTAKAHRMLAAAYPLWEQAQKRLSGLLGRQRTQDLVSELATAAEALRAAAG
ncbi:MAG: MarR family transcriptional regulator [Acidiferrobacterales bacterium]